MILADVGSVYVKLAIIFEKENSKFTISNLYQNLPNFTFIKKELFLILDKKFFIPLTFNFHKTIFQESYDYKIIKELIEIEKISTIFINCKITNIIEEIFKNLFNIPLGERLEHNNSTNLNISGIHYLSNILDNSFFDLPGQEIVNLNRVGHILKEVPIKNYVSLRNNSLYPFLLANIAEGLSLYRVDSVDNFKRIGGKEYINYI